MTFAMALIAAVLSAAQLILHVVAPKTKNTWDDKAAKFVDGAKEKLGN